MILEATNNGTHLPNTKSRKGSAVEYDFGRIIGTDPIGNPTSIMRVVFKPNGDVKTAFPAFQ